MTDLRYPIGKFVPPERSTRETRTRAIEAIAQAPALLREADGAIRENDQERAVAAVARYGRLGHDPRPVFDVLLGYAVSEDGALHAEKYYRTVSEEFASLRPAFRWSGEIEDKIAASVQKLVQEVGWRP